MLALAHANIKFPTPGDFWSGTFEDFFAAIDTFDHDCLIHAIDSRTNCMLSSTHQRFYALLVFFSWNMMSLTSIAEHCFIPRQLRKGRHTWALQR